MINILFYLTFNDFIGVGSFTDQEILTLKNSNLSGVMLELNPHPELFDTVKPDTSQITVLALKQFLASGLTKIGFIGGGFFNPDTKKEEADSREIAFRTFLQQQNLLEEKYIFANGPFSVNQGYQLGMEMLKTLGEDLPEACFIASDTLAVVVLQAFNKKQVAIPETIKLISVNDNEIAKFVSPPLTTYRIDIDEIAKTAIDMLADQIIYPREITKTVLLGSPLIIRKSFVPKE